MDDVEGRHLENLQRFALIEERIHILELEFRTGIAVFKAIGGAGLAVLTAILIKLLVG
ncbi:MAG: hypothetical protein L3K18_09540 [Thermoplasmata archaeon]|nr:hypothetical protein [Thermoplasmata archaeon]